MSAPDWTIAPIGEQWEIRTDRGGVFGNVFAPSGRLWSWDGDAWQVCPRKWDEVDRFNYSLEWTHLNPDESTVTPYFPAWACAFLRNDLPCEVVSHGDHGGTT